MSLATRFLKETATYWGPSTPNGYGGTAFGSPVVIFCRRVLESAFSDQEDARQIRSDESYVVDTAATSFAVGGRVAYGDHTGVSDPTTVDSSEVKSIKRTPDLRNTKSLMRLFV